MSAQVLREAAALMRERATEALGPDYEWAVDADAHGDSVWWAFTDEDHLSANGVLELRSLPQWTSRITLWEHITGWSPAMALAVAAWLDAEADLRPTEIRQVVDPAWSHALTVARAYLGSER